MAAMALNLAGLGKSVLQPSCMAANLNPTVRVRRKDTTVEITTLMEEHMRQLTTDFPNIRRVYISHSFNISRFTCRYISRIFLVLKMSKTPW